MSFALVNVTLDFFLRLHYATEIANGVCRVRKSILGFQGHTGRVHPWTYERQYAQYFTSLGLDWIEIAANKPRWLQHKNAWIRSIYGGRGSPLKLF